MSRNNKPKKKFKTIYYIIQTRPYFKTCGYAFSKSTAEYIANIVLQLTGVQGHIIQFTRKELKSLGFSKYAKSTDT